MHEYRLKCAHCGATFTARRYDALTCSAYCRTTRHRHDRRLARLRAEGRLADD